LVGKKGRFRHSPYPNSEKKKAQPFSKKGKEEAKRSFCFKSGWGKRRVDHYNVTTNSREKSQKIASVIVRGERKKGDAVMRHLFFIERTL